MSIWDAGSTGSSTTNVNHLAVTLPSWTSGWSGTVLFWSSQATNANTPGSPGAAWTLLGDVVGNSSCRIAVWSTPMTDALRGSVVDSTWSASNGMVAGWAVLPDESVVDAVVYTGGQAASVKSPTAFTAAGACDRSVMLIAARGAADGSTVTFSGVTGSPSQTAQNVSGRATPNRNVGVLMASYAEGSTSIAQQTATASQTCSYGSIAVILGGTSSQNASVTATRVQAHVTIPTPTLALGIAAVRVQARVTIPTPSVSTGTVVGAGADVMLKASGAWSSAKLWVKSAGRFVTPTLSVIGYGGGGGTLSWAPPVGWESYQAVEIPAAGGNITLPDAHCRLWTKPGVSIAARVQLTGGRNIVWIGAWHGGTMRLTQPNLNTDAYDKTHLAIKINDGSRPSEPRTIFLEGHYFEGGPRYYSDSLQMYESQQVGTSLYVQNFRSDGIHWGTNHYDPGPDVHADAIQFYGGPLNFFVDGATYKHLTYQGFYLDPANRSLGNPTGSATKVPWQIKNVNLVGEALTGFPRGYMLANRWPATIVNTNVYEIGGGHSPTDNWAAWPSAGLHEDAVPSNGDFVPASLWNQVTRAYTSPGYV